MKKFLLFFGLSVTVMTGFSQTVLNEVYSEPGAGKSEFIELYNSGVGIQNTDCFTILTYWSDGTNKGWYALDLPAGTIASKGWYVLAAANPFNVQSKTNVPADLNWNDINFRNGSTGGYLKKYQVSGGTYTDLALANATPVTDLSVDGDFATGHNYMTLLFQNGALINGFWGGGSTGVLPASITGMPDLTLTPVPGSCGAAFIVDFSTLGAIEFVNQAPGSDNGYARKSDGKCGSWDKTSAAVAHTPGKANGSAAGLSGSITTTVPLLQCGFSPPYSRISFQVTGVTGDASISADFPLDVFIYQDKAPFDTLDGGDVYLADSIVTTTGTTTYFFDIPQTMRTILVFKTKRGCFDKVIPIPNSCVPLPVSFKTFTATRNNRTNVFVKWETITEQNADGFAVERNINGSWEQVAFVPSQAAGGNSSSLLTYQINDLNAAKGISQYRIRQVDLDGLAKLSEVRAVRGEGQKGSTIVYPNPSADGRLNVVFQGEFAKRNITVQDMSGRIIKEWRNYTNNNIQIENLTSGFYTIRIVNTETGEQDVQKAVVNQR